MNRLMMLTAGAMALATAATPAAAQNIVANGGFEAGLANWTTNGSNAWGLYSDAIAGAQSAGTGCVGAICIRDGNGAFNTVSGPTGGSFLYQDLTTVSGATYSLSFLFRAAGDPMELAVLFGSTVAFDQTGLSLSPLTYTVNGLVATGTSTRLNFLGRQDPGFNRLDSVTVTQTAGPPTGAVPEPATWAMMIGGFGLAGAAMRRRNTRVAFAI